MKKISTLLMSFCMCAGMAWGQKLVTSVEAGKYYTLECNSTEAHNTARFLGENGLGLDGQSAKPTYLVFEETADGYYVKSSLTGKYLNQGEVIEEGTKYAVDYSKTPTTVWTIGKLADDATDVYLTIGDTKFYLNNNYGGAQHLQIVKHNPIGAGNACSLWEMREHEDGYKVIKSIGANITNLNQLTDGSYVAFYNVGRQKYIYEGTHDHKLYMGTDATVGAGHEYIFRVRKEGDKYAFMAVSGRYFSTPLDGKDVFTCGIDNAAKDEFTIAAHGEDNTKWLVKSSNSDIYWDGQAARYVGWRGNGTNSRYEIIPVEVENLEHDLANYITVDENIVKWVNIKNVRSGKYATYEGESTKMTQKTDNAMSHAFFYMTGTLSTDNEATVKATVKIHNFASDNLCAEYNSWTAAGTNWNIMASTGQNIHPGWAISKGTDLNNGSAWNNEAGGGNFIAYWNGNDQGSTWAFEKADYYTLNAKLEGLKEELKVAYEEAKVADAEGNLTVTPVTLSATNLYSNAAGETNSYAGDNLGVGALIDGDDTTFLHSNYEANSVDGLDHYIRVDMGEGKTIDYFSFGYKTRATNSGNEPKTIVVEGSNDNSKYYEITTLTNLPAGTGVTYNSEPMGGAPYRYIRFIVKETNNRSACEGHQYFAMASFNLNTVTVKDGSAVKTLVYNSLSNAIEEADATLASMRSTENDITAVKDLLTTIKPGLEVHEYPFELTKNVNDPICYFIKSARSKEWSGNYYWTFKSGKVTTIVANDEYKKDVEAYWFFMENPQNGQLQLVPFIEHLKPMGYTTVANGNDKLTNNASASGFVGTAYTFVTNAEGDWVSYPYALRPYGFDNYVSNCNGTDGPFMGFWNDLNDYGTRFDLERAEVTPSAYLRDLRTALDACPEIDENLVNNDLGYYSVDSYNVYNYIRNAGLAVYNDATSTDEVVYNQLVIFDNDPLTALEINMPTQGKFYRFSHNYGGEVGNLYVQAVASGANGKENSMLMSGDQDAKSIFYYADDQLLSYSKGLYVEDGDSRGLQPVGVAGGAAKFERGTVVGQLGIFANKSFHANTDGDIRFIDHCGSVHSADHNFTVEEVTSLPVTVTAAGWASFYAPVAVELPAGLKAYYVLSANSESASLKEITGTVPANTGVLLEGEPKDYALNIVTDVTAVDGNLLEGTVASTYIAADAYALGLVGGEVGFYIATKNQQGNTSWLNNGFKAYLPNTSGASLALRFNFGGETTAIESVLNNGVNVNAPIYDLSGRRVNNAVKGGIYIQNGKKFIVK